MALKHGALLTPFAPPHLNTVFSKEREKKNNLIELTLFLLLREHVFTAGFDEHDVVPLRDANKSESHKYLRAAELRRFDLASQGLFF